MMHVMLDSLQFPELLVEILGILANLSIPDFDFTKLAQTYDLLTFCINILSPASRHKEYNDEDVAEDDDILLEVITLLGTMSLDENMPSMISKTPTLQILVDIMSCTISLT